MDDRPSIDSPLLLTAADVGALLQISEDAVRNLHRVGALSAVKVGKVNRWRRADVERFVSNLAPESAK